MRRSRGLSHLLLSAGAMIVLASMLGCVTRGRYQQAADERDRLQERVRLLEASSASLGAERTKLLDEMEDLHQAKVTLDRDVRKLRKAEAELSENLAVRDAELAKRNAELENLRGTYEGLVADLEAELAEGQIEIRQLREGLQLNVSQDVLFASGSSEVNASGRSVLGKVAERVRKVPYLVIVEGHTDNVPISTRRYPSNWELAGARAGRVVRLLLEKGVPSERLSAVSFGQYRPRASNDTAKGRARNRRIDITLKPLDGGTVAATASGESGAAGGSAPR